MIEEAIADIRLSTIAIFRKALNQLHHHTLSVWFIPRPDSASRQPTATLFSPVPFLRFGGLAEIWSLVSTLSLRVCPITKVCDVNLGLRNGFR